MAKGLLESGRRLFICYPNGLIESHKYFEQNDDEILTRDKKQILAKKEHAMIDKNGIQYYFVNGEEDKTTPNIGPIETKKDEKSIYGTFKLFGGKKPKAEFNREAMFKIHHNLLVKSMHNMEEGLNFRTLMFIIVGISLGWILCDSFGNNEIYHQNQIEENYYPNDGNNETVVISGTIIRSYEICLPNLNQIAIMKNLCPTLQV